RILTQPKQQAKVLDTYQQILTISEFSRRWIRTYWERESTVVYPEIAVANLTPLPKSPWVLSVGRFFAGSHNKKQVELINAFRQAESGRLRGWELHLAGGFVPSESNSAYLAAVRETVGDCAAIHLHLNCSVDDLR